MILKPGPRAWTTEEFIERAIEVHGNKYDYSETQYVNKRALVVIRCLDHGLFSQKPRIHLKGHGCTLCGNRNKGGTLKNEEEFFRQLDTIFGDDIIITGDSHYSGNNEFVKIGCPHHGPYQRKARIRLRGHGCPTCSGQYSDSKGVIQVKKALDDLSIWYETEFQIPDNLRRRFDFWLPDYEIFIEYDGQQHFYGWGSKGKNDIERRRQADAWKDWWAEENGYTLLRVKFTDDPYQLVVKFMEAIDHLIDHEDYDTWVGVYNYENR